MLFWSNNNNKKKLTRALRPSRPWKAAYLEDDTNPYRPAYKKAMELHFSQHGDQRYQFYAQFGVDDHPCLFLAFDIFRIFMLFFYTNSFLVLSSVISPISWIPRVNWITEELLWLTSTSTSTIPKISKLDWKNLFLLLSWRTLCTISVFLPNLSGLFGLARHCFFFSNCHTWSSLSPAVISFFGFISFVLMCFKIESWLWSVDHHSHKDRQQFWYFAWFEACCWHWEWKSFGVGSCALRDLSCSYWVRSHNVTYNNNGNTSDRSTSLVTWMTRPATVISLPKAPTTSDQN